MAHLLHGDLSSETPEGFAEGSAARERFATYCAIQPSNALRARARFADGYDLQLCLLQVIAETLSIAAALKIEDADDIEPLSAHEASAHQAVAGADCKEKN